MKARLFGLLLLGVVVGCGGNGGSNPPTVAEAGSYRGTAVPIGFPAYPQGPHESLATVSANGDTSIRIRGTGFSGNVDAQGESATFTMSGSVVSGRLTTQRRGNGATWKFYNGEELYLEGELSPFEGPEVGTVAAVPPPGGYVGTSYVFSNGQWVEFGPATLQINASGEAFGSLSGGNFTGAGQFGGTFHSDATIHGATLLTPGVIVQDPAPSYSFDGTELIFRLNNLNLEPGACFAVLRRDDSNS